MSLRFHEISESRHRILNPISESKLMLLGEICDLRPGMTVLDLACGKGEMLCRWAQAFSIRGVGVDISATFLDAANERANELLVYDNVDFIQGNAAEFPQPGHDFDVVSCLGATWIGGGLLGTLELMKLALRDTNSLVIVGEPYWIDLPPDEAYIELGIKPDEFTTLDGMLDRFAYAGFHLVEMVLADGDNWDRYAAAQWMTVYDWLRDNPDDPQAQSLYEWIVQDQRAYLRYSRRYLGWGAFVLRPFG